MNNTWLQIGSAIFIAMLLFFIYPTAKQWLKHGPKAEAGDWTAALIPLALVVGFVILLVAMI